jgi:hypothetical protein
MKRMNLIYPNGLNLILELMVKGKTIFYKAVKLAF